MINQQFLQILVGRLLIDLLGMRDRLAHPLGERPMRVVAHAGARVRSVRTCVAGMALVLHHCAGRERAAAGRAARRRFAFVFQPGRMLRFFFIALLCSATQCGGFGPHRHIAEARQHALFDQQHVQFFGQIGVGAHHLAIEDAIEQQPRFLRQLQGFAGMANRATQGLRAKRHAFAVERRRCGEHAKSLAQKVQHQIGARFLARRDLMQDGAFVHHPLIDQGQVLKRQAGPAGRSDRCRRWGIGHAQAGQAAFEQLHEARHEVMAV